MRSECALSMREQLVCIGLSGCGLTLVCASDTALDVELESRWPVHSSVRSCVRLLVCVCIALMFVSAKELLL